MNKKVCIAMSGGVDSSVAAAFLRDDGFDCIGVFMITHDAAEGDKADAEKMANKLGIKLHILDLRCNFEKVLGYFVDEYKCGRTPNPCVFCNSYIKFGKLFEFAKSQNADYLATGHYIQQKNGKIYAGADDKKEQSYILCMVDREVFKSVLFPVGMHTKDEIREKARELDLEVHDKPDSQEICFIPDNNYIAKLKRQCPEIVANGKIYHVDGRELGEHTGVHNFTIGQRRGLGIALGEPVYVVAINAKDNSVVLGGKEDLLSKAITTDNVNWLVDPIDGEFDAEVKIRYNSRPVSAKVCEMAGRLLIEFAQPVSAATPGQAAAVYIRKNGDLYLVAGGWIGTVVSNK